MADAVAAIKKFPAPKFDQTVDIVFRLGVDAAQADQIVRGAIVLPAGDRLTRCNLPSQVLTLADGRTQVSFMHQGPAPTAVQVGMKPGALTGDAARTDPACALSPDRGLLVGARADADEAAPDFIYRQHSAVPRRSPDLVSSSA